MLVPGEGQLAHAYRQLNLPVWPFPISTPRRLFPGWHEMQSFWLARKLIREDFRLVVCNTFAAASRVMTGAKCAGLPLVIIIRDYLRDVPYTEKFCIMPGLWWRYRTILRALSLRWQTEF